MANRLMKFNYTEDNESVEELNKSFCEKVPQSINRVNSYSSEFAKQCKKMEWGSNVPLTKKEQKAIKISERQERLKEKGSFSMVIGILAVLLIVSVKLKLTTNKFFIPALVILSVIAGIGIMKTKEHFYDKKIKDFEKSHNDIIQKQSNEGNSTVLPENQRCGSRFRY